VGRHEAPKDDLTDPANTGPLAKLRAASRGQHRRAALAATGALMIVAPSAVSGSVPVEPVEVSLDSTEFDVVGPVDVTAMARVDFPRVEVRTVAAPPEPEPVVVEAPPPPPPAPPKVTVAPIPKIVASPPAAPRHVAPAPVPAPAPAPTVAAGKAAGIIAAAWAQLGRAQDCTMLATNSLRAVGINFHGWPAGYLGLGHIVPAAQAIPGDLIYYANGGMGLAHIAVYAGQGLAIHGGWNGNQTVSFSANVGSGPVFIRVH
jgi:hypothetical protein